MGVLSPVSRNDSCGLPDSAESGHTFWCLLHLNTRPAPEALIRAIPHHKFNAVLCPQHSHQHTCEHWH